MLVAEERKDVKANRIEYFKVKQIEVPESSIVLPSFWARHPLGFVVGAVEAGLPKGIDERRTIREVVFYPLASGSVQSNDVLGVVNVLYAQPEYQTELLEKALERAPAEYLKDRYWFG
jgi:hypothetical protein